MIVFLFKPVTHRYVRLVIGQLLNASVRMFGLVQYRCHWKFKVMFVINYELHSGATVLSPYSLRCMQLIPAAYMNEQKKSPTFAEILGNVYYFEQHLYSSHLSLRKQVNFLYVFTPDLKIYITPSCDVNTHIYIALLFCKTFAKSYSIYSFSNFVRTVCSQTNRPNEATARSLPEKAEKT